MKVKHVNNYKIYEYIIINIKLLLKIFDINKSQKRFCVKIYIKSVRVGEGEKGVDGWLIYKKY